MDQSSAQPVPACEVAMRKMNEFRKTKTLCDVEIIGETVQYGAHKAVLASFSKYFETMFLSQFVEAGQCSIKMPSEVEPFIEELILNYAYTYSIDLSENNIEAIFSAACFLQADKLIESCCHFLEKRLSMENCLHIAEIAEKYYCKTLGQKAKDFCLKNFSTIIEDDTFLEFNSENILIELIGDKNVNIENDELLVNAITRWVNHSLKERATSSLKLLASIRGENVNPVVPVILVFGWCTQTGEEKVYCYSCRGKLVTVLPGPPIRREKRSSQDFSKRSFCAASSDMTMVLAGIKDKIWRLDRKFNEWIELPPMMVPRYGFALTELGGYWYAIGGMPMSGLGAGQYPLSNFTTTNGEAVERYDPASNTWTSVANIIVPVCSSSAVSLRGKIYILGGITEGGCHSDHLQCYDPHLNEWTQLRRSPHSFCDGQRSCVVDDHIFCHVSTGSFDLSFYDVAENEWNAFLEHPGIYGWGPVAFNGKMYIGAFAVHLTNVILEFSFSSESWRFLPMPESLRMKGICGPYLLNRPKQSSEFSEIKWHSIQI